MMLTPYITDTLAQAHYQDLLATAQKDLLAAEAKRRRAVTCRPRPETERIGARRPMDRPLLLARRAMAAVTEVGCIPDSSQPLS